MSPVPSHHSRPLDVAAMALIVFLCFTWGFNQVAVKLALPEVAPLLQCTIRTALATLIVLLWMGMRGLPIFAKDGSLVPGVMAGLLFGAEFLFIYRGLLYTTASRAVLFIYMAPFFVVIGARLFLPGDRFGVTQWAGLVLSFIGIVIAFGVPAPSSDPHQLFGDIMMLGAAITWAATTLVIKGSALTKVSPEKTLLYQTVICVPMTGLGALVFAEPWPSSLSAVAIGSLTYQTLVVGLTYISWFALIAAFSASRLSAFTFLTPLFGVAAGHIVLGEPLTPAFLVAVALVALGLVLVNRAR
jgi:drug/metabolite transporter (DMT)-like permease